MNNYNTYFPATYQQPIYPVQQQAVYQQQIPPQQTQQQYQQIGFIRVPNEDVARNYPVAPNNSVTFIDENSPYIYTKTMDASQLDRPKFEKYRLIKEETVNQEQETVAAAPKEEYITRQEFEKKIAEVIEMAQPKKTVTSARKDKGE